jgi:hypothetical protein
VFEIFTDTDACPVKQEVYRLAQRYGFHVTLVANSRIRIPPEGCSELVVVKGAFDSVDDWIVEHAAANDIVISEDIPLAAHCL